MPLPSAFLNPIPSPLLEGVADMTFEEWIDAESVGGLVRQTGSSDDRLVGFTVDDWLSGGLGDDSLQGRAGDDRNLATRVMI